MKLFSIFKKQQPVADDQASVAEAQTNSKPSDDIITINYGTGMPIDVIYDFIKRDNEQSGYNDALVNSAADYCIAREKIILNTLNQLFDQVLLRYRFEIRQLEVKIENATALFAITTAANYNAQKGIYEDHMAKITDMKAKVAANAPEMMVMIDTYRRGFTKGCSSQAASFVAAPFVEPVLKTA